MALFLRLRCLLCALIAMVAVPASGQDRDPEGLWALRADGQILALLDLHRDSGTAGSWTGEWNRPETFRIDQGGLVSEIDGPVVRRAIRNGQSHADFIDLMIEGRTRDATPDAFVFRQLTSDMAELRLKDASIEPFALARVAAGTVVATDWDASRNYALTLPPRRSNPEMIALFEADQAARQPGRPIDWSIVSREDQGRRARTKQLLEAGALASADDYYHAAFVFQHGGAPNDFLMAHSLALIAAARGRPDSTWIAAASLDRYLQSIGHKQIYGTQYRTPQSGPATQEPYDRTLVSDALRHALGVPTQAEQERQRTQFESEARARE